MLSLTNQNMAGDAANLEQMSVTNAPRENLAPPILLQYWQIIIRHKWMILGIVLIALIAGFVVTVLTTPQYTAKARIEISREQKKIKNVESVDSA
ncbi:MAG: hypothetical protein KGQ42_10560, partial [Alphaproteobacteria bacterium]|nr:hypothetical protein [Alphaproteobacteria bacterium]